MSTPSRAARLPAAGAVALLLLAPSQLLAQKKSELPITTSSKEALSLFEQAREKVDNVEFEAAVPLLEKAIQRDPSFAMAYAYRAFAGGGFNVFRQNLDKAVSLADKVSPGEKIWILALQAQADGNSAGYREQVTELVRLYPEDKRVQAFAGTYYGSVEADLKTALQHYQKATAIDKSYAAAYNQVGYVEFRLGNYAAAETAFKQYIALRPTDPNPYDSYAELLLKTGRYDESIGQYQKAFEKDASFVSALAGIGHNYIFKGDHERARASYQRQFDQAPGVNARLGATFWKAVSYIHEGRTDAALKSLTEARAIAEKENQTPALVNIDLGAAAIVVEGGDVVTSVQYLDRAAKTLDQATLPAGTKDALRLGLMQGRARVLAAVHEFDAARAQAEKCRQLVQARQNPGEERGLQTLLAQIALEQGRYDEALQHLGQADQEDPYNWFYKALALERKADEAGASDLYAKVAGWNQNSLPYALVRARALKQNASATTEKELIAVENQWTAAVVKADVPTLESLFADEYLAIDPAGAVFTKAQDIANVKSGTFKVTDFKLDELKVRAHGEMAVVTGRNTIKGAYQGKDISGGYRFTDTFVKRAGRWQVLTTQSAAVAPQ